MYTYACFSFDCVKLISMQHTLGILTCAHTLVHSRKLTRRSLKVELATRHEQTLANFRLSAALAGQLTTANPKGGYEWVDPTGHSLAGLPPIRVRFKVGRRKTNEEEYMKMPVALLTAAITSIVKGGGEDGGADDAEDW